MKLIDQIARIDEKLDGVKEIAAIASETVAQLREDYNVLAGKVNTLLIDFEKLKASYDKTKWIWGAIAFIVTPIVTGIIFYIITHVPL